MLASLNPLAHKWLQCLHEVCVAHLQQSRCAIHARKMVEVHRQKWKALEDTLWRSVKCFVLVHYMPWTVMYLMYRRSFTGANSLDGSCGVVFANTRDLAGTDRHLQLALLARMPCVSSWKLCANQALAIPQPERERPWTAWPHLYTFII